MGFFLLAILLVFSGASYAQVSAPLTVTVNPANGPIVSVINPNNPVSAPSITDSYGATWTFNKSIPSGCDSVIQALNCQGDWPLLRNGAASDPTGTNSGIWQLKQISNDPHLYAYSMANTMWYRWDNVSWTQYGSAPPVTSTTSIPFLFEILSWAQSQSGTKFGHPFNTMTRINRLPDSVASFPSGPMDNWFVDSNQWIGVPNIPNDITWDWNGCSFNGAATTCPNTASAEQVTGANGTAGNTFFTLPSPPLPGWKITGWALNQFFNPANLAPDDTLVTSVVGNQVNLSHPLGISISNQTITFAALPDWAGLASGTYDSTVISQIQTYLIPDAARLYYIRLEHEWLGNWYVWSPSFGTSFASARVPPSQWAAGVNHLIDLLRQYLVNCGVSNGCNPNIKLEVDGSFNPTQAAYMLYTDASMPVALADKVDLMGSDAYAGADSNGNTQQYWWKRWNGPNGDSYNLGYMLTFCQLHNKPCVWPETGDNSRPPPPVGSYTLTQYINVFASDQGPGAAGIKAFAYWNTDLGGGSDLVSDFPEKVAALAQPYPNGIYGTSYDGSYFAKINVPTINPWNGGVLTAVPTTISLNPASLTVSSASISALNVYSTAILTSASGINDGEGLTTSDQTYFAVGTGSSGVAGLSIYAPRALTSADVGVHTTQICAAEASTVCATFTLTVN